MGFDAANAVPALDWDFTRYKGGKGTSPEPSSEALVKFVTEYRNAVEAMLRSKKALAVKEAEKLEGKSAEEKRAEIERWASMDWQEGVVALADEMASLAPPSEVLALFEHQVKMVAEVLQDIPSVEDINKLPGRVKLAYLGWIAGQLMSPEAGAAGTIS